ncbi:Clp protease N-terminal domain-containing protein, partial [Streptomyces xiaopingdaonensis]|uniref:Clp protease N-terminal domain-containing protein n=1 Tax=Streptomyces xiaopingdaonensis TaxID=1565415 RepID=UPI0005240642
MTTSPFGGSGAADPFSDLLNRFFGTSPLTSPPAGRRVPIGRLLTDSARELLARASGRAQQDGSADLDTEHVLWACTQVEPVRGLLAQAGADPDALARTVAEALPGESGTPSAEPGLTPAAKRVLIAAHARSRAAGVSGTGPEHVLAALLDGRDSGARRLLDRHGTAADRLRSEA